MTPRNADYPVQLDADYPDRLSRLLIFVKWLLLLPHYIALAVLGIVAYIVLIISFFAVLITGRYPESLFYFMVGLYRWGVRVGAYLFLMTDVYPPFSLADHPHYPVRVEIEYPLRISRWRPLINWLLAIPAAIAAVAIMFVAEIGVFIAWFAILITGRYPQSLFNLCTVAFRWTTRVNVFTYWMTESYPPFVWA